MKFRRFLTTCTRCNRYIYRCKCNFVDIVNSKNMSLMTKLTYLISG